MGSLYKCRIKRKRSILIIEDDELNRDILSSLLEDEFDIITAENGEEGLKLLSEHYRELSLVMLDVYMPVCNGFEFLQRVKDNRLLSSVPIIVTTGSNRKEDEVKCLDLGASDFVTKPYNSKVVLARTHSLIKLRESAATLSAIEYDSVTGLFTMQAFYHHVSKVIDSDEDAYFDLMVADLQEFKLVKGSFGERMGDDVLRFVANTLIANIPEGIFARQADKFYGFFPSGIYTEDTFEKCRIHIMNEAPVRNISMKFGLYVNIENQQPVSILCDRVLMAAGSIKKDLTRFVALFDAEISARRVREQKMEADFEKAIRNEEFVIWFQPKYDCVDDKIAAAEALVRWKKPDGSIVLPSEFIPLFERDGLISRLDNYIFTRVCLYQKKRLDEGLKVFPISINLSRNSIYDGDTVDKYARIVESIGIPKSLVPIELTESAAIGGKRICELTEELVSTGFSLHMDDFGAGYSSLSSLSELPFDELKLDKGIIDQIGSRKGDIVVKYTIKIAQELGIKVVAEGVEDARQVEFLKENGCDMIQGYYFSEPKSREEFEEMIEKS